MNFIVEQQSHLGIVVERNEEAGIERIDVPTPVYEKMQADPFSFVAAEMLSEFEVFSNWHMAIAAFATMSLIFIGQYSSDLLRAHVFPASFTWPG